MIHIGYENYINEDKVLAVTQSGPAPQKRQKQRAEDAGMYLDCTNGGRTKALIHMDDGWVVGSAFEPDTLIKRLEGK